MQENEQEDDIFLVEKEKDIKVPRILKIFFLLLILWGLWAFWAYGNGANAFVDRGFWRKLQRAAQTTFGE